MLPSYTHSSRTRSARHKVEEARSSLHASTSRGKVIDALMTLKRSGKISGIYGRLVRIDNVKVLIKVPFVSFQK